MKAVWIAIVAIVGILAAAWAGLQVRPRPFPSYPGGVTPESAPLPAGLPAPVERFYRTVYGGDRIPVIRSVVMTGRATIRPIAGIPLPARFRFTHVVGQAYRHYFEVTWFGLPFMTVNEGYLDGRGRMELPMGVVEGPKLDQAANLGMWAECATVPAALLSDARVRWEPVDDATAILAVPFGDGEERFVARFDPNTGLLRLLEAMRYRDAGDAAPKILWLAESVRWATLGGQMLAGQMVGATGAATWLDQGRPWAVFETEDLTLNADVSQYVRGRGL